MQIIDRTTETASTRQTRDGREIYSDGNPNARRDPTTLRSVMLHQTMFVSTSIERFNYVIANYIVMQDGVILFVRPLSAALNSIGTNQRAIDIEFVGNFPGAGPRGVSPGPAPSVIQLNAGRNLVNYLRRNHGIQNVFGHVQFTAKNCPGPHIWYNVGEWAIRQGMTRGHGSRTLPASWQDPSLAIPGLAG